MSATVGQCSRCGKSGLLTPLHGGRGGPLTCVHCGMDIHADIGRKRREQKRMLDAFGWGPRYAGEDELSLELIEEAVRLTHPDRHPPERAEVAARVTAELLARKPFAKPRQPERDASAEVVPGDRLEAVTPCNDSALYRARKLENPSPAAERPDYPCDACRFSVPLYYCDACRAQHDADQKVWVERCEARRRRAAARQRELRAWRKARRPPVRCAVCGTEFKGKRKDAAYCSAACRQKAHRDRVTEKKGITAETILSRNAIPGGRTSEATP